MGGSQSGGPRSVTIDNNNPIGIFDISEDVANRLVQAAKNGPTSKDQQQSQQDNKSSRPSPPPPQSQSNQSSGFSKPPQPPPSSPPRETSSSPRMDHNPSSYPNPPQLPPNIYYGHPTITALEVRKQKEKELDNNDQYWKKRMAQLEESYEKMHSINEKEYNAAIEDVRKQFQNAPPQLQLPPCQEFKLKLIECYKKNASESLMCAKEVADFSNCINSNRIQILAERKKSEEAKQK